MPDETDAAEADRAAIADVVKIFFSAFASGADSDSRFEALRQAFLPEALIVRTCGDDPVAYDVDAFIEPRRQLLSAGTLNDFREWELSGRSEMFGDIAAHFCTYAKAGTLDGNPFVGRGTKSLQLVRTRSGWKISAVAWDDERDGVPWPSDGPQSSAAERAARTHRLEP